MLNVYNMEILYIYNHLSKLLSIFVFHLKYVVFSVSTLLLHSPSLRVSLLFLFKPSHTDVVSGTFQGAKSGAVHGVECT